MHRAIGAHEGHVRVLAEPVGLCRREPGREAPDRASEAPLGPEAAGPDWLLANPAQAGDEDAPTAWYPLSRTPEMLFDFYSGRREEATFGALDSAAYDLVHLDLPPGLDRASFKEAVRRRLRALPAVQAIVEHGRMRSSELEAALEGDTPPDPGAAERALTLTRWIVEFLGDEFYTSPTNEYDIIRGKRLDENP